MFCIEAFMLCPVNAQKSRGLRLTRVLSRETVPRSETGGLVAPEGGSNVEQGKGLSRRGLLGAGVGVAASATLLGAARPDGASTAVGDGDVLSLLPEDRIGLQLYSVRDAVSEQGFDKVLAEVAAIGFKQVEFAGYTQGSSPEITVKELRALLDKYGLVAAASHVPPSDDASMQKILDDAEVLGLPQVGLSLLLPQGPLTTGAWKTAAQQYQHYGELAAKRGIGFYLHNHFQEWLATADDPATRGMDVLLAETDPRYVSFQLDIFWAHVGMAQSGNAFDPLTDYAIPQRDRFKMFHVKDGIYDSPPAGEITDVGEGKIDFQRFFTELFKQSPDEVTKHLYLWERDNAADHPRGPLAAARASYANIRYALTQPAPAPGPALPIADCTTPAGLAAALQSVRLRRTKRGRRVLALGLRLNGPAEVTVRVSRGRRTLARRTSKLGKGSPTLRLRLPRRTGKGPARLTVTVKGAGGSALTVRRAVRL
jgi:sugar phosphate isomerase/epimerase